MTTTQPSRVQPTATDGQRSLADHLRDRAAEANAIYGPEIDFDRICRLLEDRRFVRYPVQIVFDASPLRAGEFAWPAPRGESPGEGFVLYVHPHFQDRPEVLPLLVSYHLVTINYGDIAGSDEAELLGATLLGMDVETYYQSVCSLADELDAAPSCSSGCC